MKTRLIILRMFLLTNGALANAGWLADHMRIDGERMRANAEAAKGLILAEVLVFALAESVGRGDPAIDRST